MGESNAPNCIQLASSNLKDHTAAPCFVDTFHFALNRMDYICLIDFHNRSLVLFLNATKFAIPILLSNCFHFPLFPPFFCVIMRST